ncbi:phage tail protein [Acinetobacter baumannii]|uniref:phage tail protein n=1 Tax=Acinetobacter baumannii TaxID=470 RepID=UPI003B42E5C7
MATYKGILTNNGKALIAGATVSNKINYSHIAVGDGNGSVPVPSETRTALINEKARIALNVVEINPNNTNQIVCEAIIPSNVGGFYIRELGLYAGNTMVVNSSYPPTYKPLADEGGAREINIKLVINIQNAEVIALYLDDSLIYATREWVNKNYIRRNEIVDNLTTDDPTKPLSAKQGKYLQDNKLDNTATAVAAKKLEIERTSFSNDDDFIKYLADKPTSFFDNETGKYFAQFSVGFVSTLKAGGTFIIGNDVVTGKTKIISCVVRDDGKIDLLNKKELAYTDSSISGNAATASKLATARTVSFSGAATGAFNYDGSSNSTCILTLANSGVVAGTYASTIQIPSITVNDKGQITGISQQNIRAASTNQSGVVQLADDLQTDDANKALTAKQGKALQDNKLDKTATAVAAKKLEIETTSFENDTDFIKYFADKPKSFFDNQTGKFFAQYSVGLVSSLKGAGTFIIGNDIVTGKTKIISCVVRDDGTIDLLTKKELAYTDSSISGNAATASKLATARTVSFSGAATGAFNYDGSSNSTCILTLANSGVVAGTYASTIQIPSITVNDKGQITGISQQNIRAASTNQSGVVQLADDLQTDDANKALTAKQGKALQDNKLDKTATAVAAKKLEIETTSFENDTDFIKYFADKPKSFFDNQTGKFFAQYSVGLVSSLKGAGTFIIGNDVVTGKTKIISCVVRDDGTIDLLTKKELAYTDSNITGNAATATKLQIARNIGLTGAVSGSANFDGAGNITINTTSNNAIGIGQTWQDVKANRSLETTYLNSTGRPIQLCLTFPDTNGATIIIEVIVDGNSVFKHTYDVGTNYGSGFYSFIVPAGSTYKISANTSAIQPSYWSELR